MNDLIFCLNATMPVFLLMVLGFFFRRIRLFDDRFISQANKFVFTAALPFLVFQDLAESDFAAIWNGSFVFFCFLATILSILLAFAVSLLFRNAVSQGEFVQGAYRSSAALLGIALIVNIYGSAGAAPLMIIGAVPLYNIAAVLALEFLKPGEHHFHRKLLRQTLKNVACNPILLGILAGILWSLLRLPQPPILMKTIGYIGNLATPLGLIAMGASFSFRASFHCLGPILTCTFLKLIGFAALFLPLAVRFGFREDQLIAILIMLASPTTVSGFVMAKNMGHDGRLSSGVVMFTTLFSAFTLTGWLYILRSIGLV